MRAREEDEGKQKMGRNETGVVSKISLEVQSCIEESFEA